MKEVINFYKLHAKKCKTFPLMFITLLSFNFVWAQQSTILGIVIQGTSADLPLSNGIGSQNPELNNLLSAYNVFSYAAAFPVAKTLKAQNCFEIILTNASDNDYLHLSEELVTMNYEEVIVVWPPEITGNYALSQDPDPCVEGLGGHYLENARVRKAWDITHGDPNIIIGLVDQFMDYDHDDLQGKIVSIWNKVTAYNLGC